MIQIVSWYIISNIIIEHMRNNYSWLDSPDYLTCCVIFILKFCQSYRYICKTVSKYFFMIDKIEILHTNFQTMDDEKFHDHWIICPTVREWWCLEIQVTNPPSGSKLW